MPTTAFIATQFLGQKNMGKLNAETEDLVKHLIGKEPIVFPSCKSVIKTS
jgi:hypothetical protein